MGRRTRAGVGVVPGGAVTEYPVFVPWEGEHLAAIVSVPNGTARGLTVLSTGVGAPRSHRFQMWAKTAERLGERGIATVRWEYVGMHDSTGDVVDVMNEDVPLKPALAVTRFALDGVGARYVVFAGNCIGAELALFAAAETPECVGALCVLPLIVEPGNVSRFLRRVAAIPVVAYLRSNRFVRPAFRQLRRLNMKPRPSTRGPLFRALARGRVLFLFGEDDREARAPALDGLRHVVGGFSKEHRDRFELRTLSGSELDRFGSIGVQEAFLDAVVEWIDGCFTHRSVGAQARAEPR